VLRVACSIPFHEYGALTCVSELVVAEKHPAWVCLVPHAVLAVEDALHNRRNSPMSSGVWEASAAVADARCDVSKQVPRIMFADDLKLGQGNEERSQMPRAAMPSASLKRACSGGDILSTVT
jgi:hypothetical protein